MRLVPENNPACCSDQYISILCIDCLPSILNMQDIRSPTEAKSVHVNVATLGSQVKCHDSKDNVFVSSPQERFL